MIKKKALNQSTKPQSTKVPNPGTMTVIVTASVCSCRVRGDDHIRMSTACYCSEMEVKTKEGSSFSSSVHDLLPPLWSHQVSLPSRGNWEPWTLILLPTPGKTHNLKLFNPKINDIVFVLFEEVQNHLHSYFRARKDIM